MPASSIHSAGRAQKSASDPGSRPDGEIRNKILRRLPSNELDALLERSEIVEIKSKQILYQPEEKLEYVHFPKNCVISLVTVMKGGDQVEAMTVGSDGFSEIPVFHGVETSMNKGVGQISGVARRLSVKDFRDLVDECPSLRRLLHRYAEFVFGTVAQSAACNRLHVIEQRCARWLLMSEDRVGRNRFDLTQEFLAEMLGVRRPGVTVAMGILERAGLIAHGRGNITVVNRPGLEKASCECYRTIRARQAKLMA